MRTSPSCRLTGLALTGVLSSTALLGCVPAQEDSPGGKRGGSAWNAASAELLFTATKNGNVDLFLLRNGDTIRMTDEPAADNWGMWSPDGTRIAFQSQRGGSYDVFVMNADGSGQVNLSNHPAHDGLPVWSPDGTRIAFFSSRELEYAPGGPIPGHIYVMDADGSGVRRLTTEPLSSTLGPGAWSPDGHTILLSRMVDESIQIFALEVEQSTETPVGGDIRTSNYGAAYSPDGSRIAFHAESGEHAAITVTHADGSGKAVLTAAEGQFYSPSWSPDGRWLVFTAVHPDGKTDLMAMRADGTEQVTLISAGNNEREGRWRPVS